MPFTKTASDSKAVGNSLSVQLVRGLIPFGYGPMECETTDPCFSSDEQALFLSVQHQGEVNGLRQGGATGDEDRKISMRTPDGQEFVQTR